MLEKIKARVKLSDLFDVLGVRVKGRHASCPLHEDRTPSLSFKDNEGLWYCFVCGVGGDVVNLVMESQGLSFKESLAWLNDKFSLGLTSKKPKRNFYLESLNENYQALRDSFLIEFDENCERHYELMKTPEYLWSSDDYLFEYQYDEKQNLIEQKLRELENARYKLRRTASQ